jgi:hypothetical protein
MKWFEVKPEGGTMPRPRNAHTATALPFARGGAMVVVGGATEDGPTDEVLVLHGAGSKRRRIPSHAMNKVVVVPHDSRRAPQGECGRVVPFARLRVIFFKSTLMDK